METLSACALTAPEIQDKFPLGLLFISLLCYAMWTFVWKGVCVFVCVNTLTACMLPWQNEAMFTCRKISSGLNVFFFSLPVSTHGERNRRQLWAF